MNVATSRATNSGGPSDEEIVRRTVGGDRDAFGILVRRYQDRLHNAAYRLVGSAEDARDIVQDSFVKAYRNLGGFRGHSSLYTWLFRIVVNMSLSHRRKRKRKWMRLMTPGPDRGDEAGPAGLPDASAADPADPLVTAETEAIVQRALDDLDEEHRTVVVLRDIQHFDYHEIAEILDVPTGTVKSRLHRARLMLRDRLKPLLTV